jgi:FtsP/CotA-like multicopper oxidase with cupredoxin domain
MHMIATNDETICGAQKLRKRTERGQERWRFHHANNRGTGQCSSSPASLEKPEGVCDQEFFLTKK